MTYPMIPSLWQKCPSLVIMFTNCPATARQIYFALAALCLYYPLSILFFRGQEGEEVVAASQADIPAALRTVFCKLLFELQSFYITNSQLMRR